MEFRSLTRYHTLTKAINKRNNKALFQLNQRQVSTLFAVYLCSCKSPIISATLIHLKCRKLNAATNIDIMYMDLVYLASNGLLDVMRNGKWKANKYSLTFEGLTELQEFERLHRLERLDR